MIAGKKMILVEITVYKIPHNYSFLCELISTKFWKYRCFSKVTKLHHICTLHVRIKFNITHRKLTVIANYYKYNRIWPLNIINELQISIVLSIRLSASWSEHANTHSSLFTNSAQIITFFSLNADRRILWSHKG